MVSPKGYVRFEERDVHSATANLAAEAAHPDPRKGIHIRCLYNNKFLVRDGSTELITASSKEKVEDQMKEICTLFRYTVTGNNTMKLIHVQTGRTVSIEGPEEPLIGYYLCVKPSGSEAILEVEALTIDVNRIIKLPKYVVFKGDNGKYLRSSETQFQVEVLGQDRHDKEAWFETFPTSNGDVRLKSVRAGKFLRRRAGDNGIVADTDDPTSYDSDTVFEIAKLSSGSVALRNRGNDRYFQRMPDLKDCLSANADSGIKLAEMLVEEPVTDRKVEIQYRLQDARIYDTKPVTWTSAEVRNPTKEENYFTLETKYTESFTWSWHVSGSITTNVSVKLSAGIPFITKAESTVEVGATVESGYEETRNNTKEHMASITVKIPAGEKRAARMLSMQAKCDVPYTSVQIDTLANNTQVVTRLQDGVFHGLNGYQFVLEVFDPEGDPAVAIVTKPWRPITLPPIVQA
ncbi:uncharacterized protein LOC141614838 isoform X2 [Silene latifolia]|uniref:uncharacterized protein LOC141614838 isoform X2 n=1 Tax=Silene latifolia TaxID=37657 RepID=UPI003D7809D1